MKFHETILRRWLDRLGIPKENFRNSPTKSWLYWHISIVEASQHAPWHCPQGKGGAWSHRGFPAGRPCEFSWPQKPTDYHWLSMKRHTFEAFWTSFLIWGMLAFGRQELLAQEKVERSKHHTSVEERAMHSDFQATSIPTAAVSLFSQ